MSRPDRRNAQPAASAGQNTHPRASAGGSGQAMGAGSAYGQGFAYGQGAFPAQGPGVPSARPYAYGPRGQQVQPPTAQAYPKGQRVAPGYGPGHPGAMAAAPAPSKKRRGAAFWIGIVVAIVAVVAAVLLALSLCSGGGSSNRAGAPGQLENKSPEEIQAELNRQVEEGMFNISIASVTQFADGASEGELRIENVPGNRYLMQVTIQLDDTGQVIYESGIIEPDHHIQRDRLAVDLPAGDYDATATFTALDPQTEEEVGKAAARTKIQVLA